MDFIEGILRLSDLFDGVSDGQLKNLLPFCREDVYETGSILFSEGTPCQTMYIVESGSVALEMNLQVGRGAGRATIGVITRGGVLGCAGLVSPCVHMDTGRTLERTELIALDIRVLRRLFEENPQVGRVVMNNLAKVVRSRLEHTRKTLGHILAVVFHDIKAPLASVESVNRLILGGYAGELDEEQKSMLQSSSQGISALLSLLDNILSVSRIGIRDTVMSKISLAQVIEDSVNELRPLAEEKELEIKVDVAQGLPEVCGDGAQLKQVILNLLSNGIKYTPSGGMVTVKAREANEHIRIEVIDTGIGIPAVELPKIFDEFYRGLDLTERGAGLGLNISKRIVEGHRGKIWAVSPCPGSDKGSQFVVTLPKNSNSTKQEALVEVKGRSGNKQI